jgi:hypothetical protein
MALAGLAAPAVASAEPPPVEVVFLGFCDVMGVEQYGVAAGAELLVSDGWGAGPRGSLDGFLRSQRSTVTVQRDGEEPVSWDASGDWSSPVRLKEDRVWVTQLDLRLDPLAAGESVTVTRETMMTRPVMDLFFEYRSRPHQHLLRRGDTLTSSCTFTGED